MAEQEKVDKGKGAEPAIPANKTTMARMLPGLIVAAAVVVFAAAGFFVGRLFGTRGSAQTASGGQSQPTKDTLKELDAKNAQEMGWFYELDPVVANLNEPGVTRYARITLTLEIIKAWTPEEAKLVLDQKRPLMKHWLTLYLANQKIEDTRGENNLVRMQNHICDAFNQGLFPDGQPRIKTILFKEFAIQ